MAQAGSTVAGQVVTLLKTQETGLANVLAALMDSEGEPLARLAAEAIRAENIAPDLVERSAGERYPAVHVYCEKLTNSMREKFRTFSGKARMVIEARVSQDRLEGLEKRSHQMADAITMVLDASRGDWERGMFYGGGYEVVYGAVKPGGKHYLQVTRVVFEVDVSI